MHLAVTGINHQPFIVWLVNQYFPQLFPDAFIWPANKPAVSIAPAAIVWWQISPWGTSTHNPKNRINEQTVIPCYTAPTAGSTR